MSSYIALNQINVSLDFGHQTMVVGRLASRNHTIYFEFDPAFIRKGLPVSPIRLPVEPGVKTFTPSLFAGLPGVFNDSLPDGWGRLLLDRMLRSKNVLPSEFSPLDRLAHVGRTGLGALVYEPDQSEELPRDRVDLDVLASHTQEVINGEAEEVLQELIALNGSSAGARPKALIGVDAQMQHIVHGTDALPDGFAYWLVKFSNSVDGADAGAIEYAYAQMAQKAGVEMSATQLFPAKSGSGYFATRRFDRDSSHRWHVHTASGLLHADFRVPSLDYEQLIELTEVLTRDVREVEKMFRLAVFNVLAHNRDDHGKNFSFLMDAEGTWKLAPAYDLTFSSGPRGEQSTMVMGEGAKPTIKHLEELGRVANLQKKTIADIISQTQEALLEWPKLAQAYGVSKSNVKLIQSRVSAC